MSEELVKIPTPLLPNYFTDAMKTITNLTRNVIEETPYFKRYMYLPYDKEHSKTGTNNCTYVLDQSHDILIDLIEELDVVINTEDVEKIESIEIEIGGQRFDKIYLQDAYCKCLEDIYQRWIQTLPNGKTKIPLHLCPLLGDSYLFINPSNIHMIKVIIRMKGGMEPFSLDTIGIWGKTITLDNKTREKFIFGSTQLITQQTQYTGVDLVKNGVYTLRLNFNHPAYALFFHFGSKHKYIISKLKNVCLKLDGFVYYDGPVEMLQMYDGYIKIDFLPGKSPVLDPMQKTYFWSFSNIDRGELIFTFEGLEDTNDNFAYVFLHSYQMMIYMKGMYGLRYSK